MELQWNRSSYIYTNVKNDETFIKFMKDIFNFDCASDVNKSTTLRGTIIDLPFSRHFTLETLPFISYFFYHRPILNREMVHYHAHRKKAYANTSM